MSGHIPYLPGRGYKRVLIARMAVQHATTDLSTCTYR